MPSRVDSLPLLALLGVMACASGASRPTPVIVAEPRDALLSDLRGRQASSGEGVVRDSIAASPAQVHQALVEAFKELGIPTEIADPATGQVANTQFRVGRSLAGARLSLFLSCGETLTGPRADSDRVVMAVVSTVAPAGAASRVETRVVGVATDTGGTGGRLACNSTGELEARLHRAVKRMVGG
jgi:hypothetical protein